MDRERDDYVLFVHEHDGDRVLIAVWRRMPEATNPNGAMEMANRIDVLSRKGACFVLSVSVKGCEVAPPDTLYRIVELLQQSSGNITAWAAVTLDNSWRARLMATLTWTVLKMSEYKVPHRPFLSYRSAAKWFFDDWRVDKYALEKSVVTALETVIEGRPFMLESP